MGRRSMLLPRSARALTILSVESLATGSARLSGLSHRPSTRASEVTTNSCVGAIDLTDETDITITHLPDSSILGHVTQARAAELHRVAINEIGHDIRAPDIAVVVKLPTRG